MGIHRHYKGPLYLVIGLAHDANDESRTCVVYLPLQLKAGQVGPRMAVRTIEDFTALVAGRPRFAYLGPELTSEMLDATE